MINNKFFNKNTVLSLILVMTMLIFSCMAVSARTLDEMKRDGIVSDEGVPEGNINDGIVSDSADYPFETDNNPENSESGSDNMSGTSDTSEQMSENEFSDNILGGQPNDTMINENDFSSSNDSTTDGVGTDGINNAESDGMSVVGIVIAILVIIAIIIIIIALIPKKRNNDGE